MKRAKIKALGTEELWGARFNRGLQLMSGFVS
jgi:hypothetical protein